MALPSAVASDNHCDPSWAIANVTSPFQSVESSQRKENKSGQGKEKERR